tara:strand:- start:7 stop:918 length:912 start_codon:yes stop_codon:yes gene_type:complete
VINLKLKKIKNCIICRSSNFKKISSVKNKTINSRIKKKLFLIECNSCLHRTFSEIPGDSQLKKAYANKDPLVWGVLHNEPNHQNKNNDCKFSEIKPLANHWILKYIDINNKKNYFELGPGAFNLYKTFYNKGWQCHGIEPNSLVKAPGIKKDFKEISIKADVSVATDVLEHVNDPVIYLKKINSIMKKNGKIFLTFPNSQSFKSVYLKDKWSMVSPFGHINFFSKTSTAIMLEKSKFKVVLIKDFCYVEKRRLIRNILKLPIYLIKDLFSLNLKNFIERLEEAALNILDLINGDQLKVVAIKL